MAFNSGKSVKKNYIYNVSFQILLLITPLITTPYLSRILGADGIGTVSFAESIISYFVLFATFGMTTYGQREVSYVQDDRENRTKVFWETKILEVVTSTIALLVYIPLALYQQNRYMYLVLILNILAVIANVTWFFQGMEEFGKIALRNIVFKILNIAYIFVFVKTKNDTVIYAFGIGFFLLISNISMWLYLPRFIDKPDIKELQPFKNFRVVLSLFVPTIAVQIYTVLDKTMIGIITQSSFENGYYEQAIKISKMVLTIVTSLGTVMIPRIGYHFAKQETERVKFFMYRAYRFVWFMGVPLCFGLLGIASNFVPWFYGEGYEKVVPLLSILGFLVLAIGINNVTGIQYFIPTKRQNLFTLTVIIGAIVNFSLNLMLIRNFQSIGAAIASVVAEMVIAVAQIYIVRKELSPQKIILSSRNYFLAGGVMLAVLIIINSRVKSSIVNTGLLICAGGITYLFVLMIIRDDFLNDNINSIMSKIKKKRAT